MNAKLKRVEIENFKSFRGLNRIGPLKQLSVVTGPNGSGKSNFMDAVSFAACVKTSRLRTRQLSHLAHCTGTSDSTSTAVTLVLELHDAVEMYLTRRLMGNVAKYMIDQQDVTKEEYLSKLKDLGISEYFFIFQGASQDFAMKKPKEHTSLLEVISGSVSFKEQYDTLNNELQAAQELLSSLRAHKKIVGSEFKNLKSKLDDATKLEEIQISLKEKKLKLMLLKLYYNNKKKDTLRNNQALKVQQLNRLEQEDINDIEALRKMKSEYETLLENLTDLRNEQQQKESEYKDLQVKFDKIRMNLEVLKDKINDNRKQLKRARDADEKCQYQVSALQDAINELMKELRELEEQTPPEAEIHHLTDEKVQEYCRLKSIVDVQAAVYISELGSLEDEQARDQKIIDDEVSNSDQEKKKLQEYVLRKKLLDDKRQQFSEHLKSVEERIELMKQKLKETVPEETQEIRRRELMKSLAEVDAVLLDVNLRKEEETKKELIRKLQSLFPGVYGRVVDLCSPVSDEYKIASTRVIGNKMGAIIVAAASTAIQCIDFLREQRLRETFLPLDILDPKDYYHLLHNKPFVRDGYATPLLDLLHFNHNFKKAIVTVTGNVVVCFNDIVAQNIAYNETNRFNAVTLEGTMYKRSGLISGGMVELERRAGRWLSQDIMELRLQKKQLEKEFQDITLTISKRKQQISAAETDIFELEGEIRRYKILLKNIENDMAYTEQRINQIKNNVETSENIMMGLKDKLTERHLLMEEIRGKIESVKDNVFQNFLREVGSPNINVFEQRDYRIYKEKLTKKLELQDKLEFLKQQRNFEVSRGTADKIDLWTKILREKQDMYEELQKEEKRLRDQLAALSDDSATLERNLKEAEARGDTISEKIKQLEKRINNRDHEKWMASTTIEVLETNWKQQEQWYKKLLLESKVRNIDLPFVRGSLADVSLTSSSSDTSAERTVLRSDEIEVDFSSLSEEDKTLSAEDFDLLIINMESEVQDLEINSPDSPDIEHVIERMNTWKQKMGEVSSKLKREIIRTNDLRKKFNNVKKKRFDTFMACFKHISSVINNIYKDLMQSDYCHVMLTLENEEEPYLDGVQVCFVEHGKPCISMTSLSGGEAVMAGLAFTFALHSFLPSPLVIFDEVDDALDADNVERLVKYLNSAKHAMQVTVITLNKKIASDCDVLVGLCPNHTFKEYLVTKIIILNLSLYLKDGETQLKEVTESSGVRKEKEGE